MHWKGRKIKALRMQALAPSLFVLSVVSSRHAVEQNHHGSMQPGDNIDVFLLPSGPMTFHNVIVVSHPAAECRMRGVELAMPGCLY